MNTAKAREICDEQEGKLKQQFDDLYGNDSMFEEGKKNDIMSKLLINLEKAKVELHKMISSH